MARLQFIQREEETQVLMQTIPTPSGMPKLSLIYASSSYASSKAAALLTAFLLLLSLTSSQLTYAAAAQSITTPLKPAAQLPWAQHASLFWSCWSTEDVQRYLADDPLTTAEHNDPPHCTQPSSQHYSSLTTATKNLLRSAQQELHTLHALRDIPHPIPYIWVKRSRSTAQWAPVQNIHHVSRSICWKLSLRPQAATENNELLQRQQRALQLDPYAPMSFIALSKSHLCYQHHIPPAPISMLSELQYILESHFPLCSFSTDPHAHGLLYSCPPPLDLSSHYVSFHRSLNGIFVAEDFLQQLASEGTSLLPFVLHEAAHYYAAHAPHHQDWWSFRWHSFHQKRTFSDPHHTHQLITQIAAHRPLPPQALEALAWSLPFSKEKSLLSSETLLALRAYATQEQETMDGALLPELITMLHDTPWHRTSAALKGALQTLSHSTTSSFSCTTEVNEPSLYEMLRQLWCSNSVSYHHLQQQGLELYNSEVAADELMTEYLIELGHSPHLALNLKLLPGSTSPIFSLTHPPTHLPAAVRYQHIKKWIKHLSF